MGPIAMLLHVPCKLVQLCIAQQRHELGSAHMYQFRVIACFELYFCPGRAISESKTWPLT